MPRLEDCGGSRGGGRCRGGGGRGGAAVGVSVPGWAGWSTLLGRGNVVACAPSGEGPGVGEGACGSTDLLDDVHRGGGWVGTVGADLESDELWRLPRGHRPGDRQCCPVGGELVAAGSRRGEGGHNSAPLAVAGQCE